jgi:hypothetical protein
MDLSRLRTRRGIVAALAAVAFSRVLPQPARAQLNADCEYGITNGLITIGGAECDLAVPQHMVDGRSNVDGDDGIVGSTTESPNEIRTERLQRKRDHKREKRGRRTERNQDQQDRKVERRILCEDFSTQLQAVEAMSHSPSEAWRLDPDGDGIPCEELTPLTCSAFDDEAEATNWFNKMGYTKEYDPFKLYDKEADSVCSTFRVTCKTFTTQKQAVEWMTDHPKDAKRLDPDSDGAPCANLPPVTCKAFTTQDEAKQWFNRNGFTPAKDPYKLIDPELNEVCPKRAICDDFTTQKAAVEWLAHSPQDKKRLDPDGDGKACETLPVVTCKSFSTQADAKVWFNLVGFTKNNDPYGLWDTDTDSVCGKKVTCADFSTQKAAVEWLSQNPGDKATLDPDNDGRPCENLTTVTCSQLGSKAAAKNWFDQNNFTPVNDPYDLYDDTEMKVCPANG